MDSDQTAHRATLQQVRRRIQHARPETDDLLHAWIRVMLGLNVRRTALVEGHAAPFDYLCHAFFEDRRPQRNAIVWAARGTGKTYLGAVATLLDLIFKPGIEICILGGSFTQSSRMHEHLRRMFESESFSHMLRGSIARTHMTLRNGSRVDVLCRSQTNIRGRRAHRLRCDEVELFEPEAWEAAQLITRSGRCGDVEVRAGVEALSTMHRPFGLMSRLVRDAEASNTRVFRWSVIDVLEDCPDERHCEMCPLFNAHEGGCHGRAKLRPVSSVATAPTASTATLTVAAIGPDSYETGTIARSGSERGNRMPRSRGRGGGFFRIEDALDHHARISPSAWRSEMLCQEPDVSDCVYPEFSEAMHVFDDASAPAINASITWLGGIDFGYREPAALLLAALDGAGRLHVMDEIVRSGCPTPQLIDLATARCAALGMHGSPPQPEWIGADPAGLQRSDQSGVSTITLWRRAGFAVHTRGSRIEAGLESVRARLRSGGANGPGVRVHRRCTHLIRALREYHYSPSRREETLPIKDGPDHACDALRYLIVNLDGAGGQEVSVRDYMNRP